MFQTLLCPTNFSDIDFQCFVSDFFFNARSKFSHVEEFLKTLRTIPSTTFLLYCKGAQPLKFRMVPVSVRFWYHPHVTFFPEPTLTFKSEKATLPLLSSSSMVNLKFECNLLAASRTTPGSPLTVLTRSSHFLEKLNYHSQSDLLLVVFCKSCNTILFQRYLRIRIPICYQTLSGTKSNKLRILPL